jgi:hypothetical protein
VKGLGHLGSVDPGAHTNLVVVVGADLGQRGSFLFEVQFGGHLGSVEPGVHENLVVVGCALVVTG